MNRDPATDKIDPLAHAHEPESNRPVVGRNEPHSGIGNGQIERAAAARELDVCTPGATVLDHVVQGFLHDSIETKRYLRRNRRWDTLMAEINGDAVLTADVTANAVNRRNQPQGFELRRMELMRQAMNIGGDFGGSP